MCGIVGCFCLSGSAKQQLDLIDKMNDSIAHRGPDDYGVLAYDRCVLGHRRLSIIDLSSAGHQPFCSQDGRFSMVYNGEVYNYIELREELKGKGYSFTTATDTEVLLAMYQEFGEECLHKLNGMFAFAIFDRQEGVLFLARDRVGIKPLYYTFHNGILFFASEIKALREIPGRAKQLNEQAVFDYLCFNRTDIYDETFDVGIKRLPKGHYAFYTEDGFSIKAWWNPFDFLEPREEAFGESVLEKIESLFVSAVKLRMRSDVPVGSCLSGGLDSSIILGIIKEHALAGKDYKTFTASFPGYPIDETRYVDYLKSKYEFQNVKTYPDASGAHEHFQKFSHFMDEPCSSPTFYSQYEVMRIAKEHGVTVLLDGQGGDEIFAGYQYFHGFNFTELLRSGNYRRLAKELLSCMFRRQEKEAFFTFLFQELPDEIKKALLLQSLGYVRREFFHSFIESSRIFSDFFRSDSLNQSLANHFKYKLEHLLRAEDRNSMAFALEARLPYLDYRLIEYTLSLSSQLKIERGENKLLQKKALGNYSIPQILERRDKIGFGTPAELWMKNKAWQDMTISNYEYLCNRLSHVFKKDIELKYNLFDRWKINQLANWLQTHSYV